MELIMTSETLSLVAGILLSLAFSYVPGLREHFDALDPTRKRLVLLGALLAVSIAIYGLACSSWGAGWGVALSCDRRGLAELVRILVLAVVASQAAYQLAPRA
jgi:hypothetical protein